MARWSGKTWIYIALAHLAGIAVWIDGWDEWTVTRILQFLFYCFFCAASSTLKVALPGIKSSLSVNYVFILLAALDLSLPQTMGVALAGNLTQCAMGTRRRPNLVQISFNLSGASLCAWLTYRTMHWEFLRSFDSSVVLMLFWGSISYYLVNTMTISGVIAMTERRSVLSVWYEGFFWTGPQYLFGGALAALMHNLNDRFGWQYSTLILPAVYLLYRSYYLYLHRLEEEKKHVQEVADLHLRTIEALALAIEAKDETTHAHLRRVQVYATEIGKEFKLSDSDMQALRAAALLHDIGKLAVPEYILSKPGRLTVEEFEKIKIHPVVGAKILSQVNFPYPVADVVLAHHEKWDGNGYPHGLKGKDIPIGARILSVVDVLDALASDRQYRQALPLEEAIESVCALAGKSFDPEVVDVLRENYQKYEAMVQEQPYSRHPIGTISFERGAPAAGFAAQEADRNEERPASPIDFIALIAAARQEFHLLHETTRDLGNSLRVEETFTLLASRLKPLIPFSTIVIYRHTSGSLTPHFVSGVDEKFFASLVIPVGEGLSGWVAENRKPVLNGNPAVEAGHCREGRQFCLLQSAMAIPLQSPSGVVGVLALYHSDADAFTRDHLRILLAIGSKVALTIENAFEYNAALKNAETDPLTGLLNAKALFMGLNEAIEECRSASESLTVFVLDLDGFKQVNDRLGHLVGNRVLTEVSTRLRAECRKTDSVARMGGDEFVVVCPGMSGPESASRAQRIETIVSEISEEICGNKLLSVSVGSAALGPDGDEASELLAVADERMYAAKNLHHEAMARNLR